MNPANEHTTQYKQNVDDVAGMEGRRAAKNTRGSGMC